MGRRAGKQAGCRRLLLLFAPPAVRMEELVSRTRKPSRRTKNVEGGKKPPRLIFLPPVLVVDQPAADAATTTISSTSIASALAST